jgi:hypothetical protein
MAARPWTSEEDEKLRQCVKDGLLARRPRVNWTKHDAELRALIAAGTPHAKIAERFGCSDRQVAQACLRRGIKMDPAHIKHNRAVSVRAAMKRPEVRERKRQARLRMLAENPAELERLKANLLAVRTPEIQALISKKQSERQLAHIPPPFRERYRALIKGGNRAADALARLQPEIGRWLQTFDGMMWRVRTGQARVVPNVKVTRPLAYVPGALAGAMS